MKEPALSYHAVLPKAGCSPGPWDTCSIPSHSSPHHSSSDPRLEPLQRSTAQRARGAMAPLMGFQQHHVTKQKAHFPQSSGQAQPSTCGRGFHHQCLVCVWKPGSVGDCSVCVKVLFEKKIYTPVGSVSCNPFFTTTVHILQGHFLSHTGTSWKTYKFKRKDLPIV